MMNPKIYFRRSFKQAVILAGSLIVGSIANAGNTEKGNVSAAGK